MPFPVDKKYIQDTEKELGLIFPNAFIEKMCEENGGELETDGDAWQLFPFFDQSDSKRISRTCNHIILETNNAREWVTFPEDAIAIGENGCDDYLILTTDPLNDKQLLDTIYVWRHETAEIETIADNVFELMQ